MLQADYPIANYELLLTVVVGLDGQSMWEELAKGFVPPSVSVTAQIDTGSNVTAISQNVVTRLNLLPKSLQQTQTAGGKAKVGIYSVSVRIVSLQQNYTVLTIPTLTVMELPYRLPNIDVLIGMDVLAECRLLVDGPAQQFSLSA